MNLFSGPLILISCVLLEFLVIKFIQKEEIPWKEVTLNLNSGHILMWFFRAFEVMIFQYVLTNYSLHWVTSWPVAVQWIFTFFAWDFCFYWLHRMHHKIPLFWDVHSVHHQGEHFSLSLGIRNSWYSSLSSIPFFQILAVLGVPLEIFIPISSFHYFVQFYNHTHVVNKSGFLDDILVTPSNHRVHHGINPEYLDKNCGGTFAIWDKMFGTYQKELDDVEIKYGIFEPIKTDNPFWANNIPFLEHMKIKLPSFEQKEEDKIEVEDGFIGSSGLVLFFVVIYYIYCQDHGMNGMKQLLFFMLIFFDTIAIGAVSDKRLWGMIAWILISSFASVAFVMYYSMFEPVSMLLFTALFLHGAYGMFKLVSSKSKKTKNSLA